MKGKKEKSFPFKYLAYVIFLFYVNTATDKKIDFIS